MRLSLSVRIAEALANKAQLTMPFPTILNLAREIGYEGVCLRGSVANVASPPEAVAAVRRLVEDAGLAVSMVTGDVALAVNDEHAIDAIRNITPYLDLAEALGTQRVRVMMHSAADIPYAQGAADEARERGLLLCHQTHIATIFEWVSECLEVIRAVDRANFGLTFEPSNLLVCGDDYGVAQIARLGPYIFNVYLQNWQESPEGTVVIRTNHRGPVRVNALPLGDKRGIDLDRVFAGLQRIHYAGWVTVHSTMLPGQTVEEAARESYQVLAKYVA